MPTNRDRQMIARGLRALGAAGILFFLVFVAPPGAAADEDPPQGDARFSFALSELARAMSARPDEEAGSVGPSGPAAEEAGLAFPPRPTDRLMPLERARVSSPYGMRRHPMLGFSMLHPGIDLAAPAGTPVFATGDGIVVEARRRGVYGNYIRIRHDRVRQTAYAHLSGFAPGIATGVRVRRGELIGYVGATGRATGSHLHYEVLVNGRRVDPLSVGAPGEQLSASPALRPELERMRAAIIAAAALGCAGELSTASPYC